MKRKTFFLFLFQIAFLKCFGQLETYYHKIEAVANDEKSAANLFKRIDSIKQTRQPHNSEVTIYFNRNVDFGYKHQRINVVFNGLNQYQVNLLIKDDCILFSSVIYDNSFYEAPAFDKMNQKENHPKIDTVQVLEYLKRRNAFYKSSKSINDLIHELNLNKTYAFFCGDGSPQTTMGKYIERIVKNNNIKKLKNLLVSFCCEEQAYGVAGIQMLQKKDVDISSDIIKIAAHIKERKSALVTCAGCLTGIVSTDY